MNKRSWSPYDRLLMSVAKLLAYPPEAPPLSPADVQANREEVRAGRVVLPELDVLRAELTTRIKRKLHEEFPSATSADVDSAYTTIVTAREAALPLVRQATAVRLSVNGIKRQLRVMFPQLPDPVFGWIVGDVMCREK